MLHWPGSPDSEAAVTSVGLREGEEGKEEQSSDSKHKEAKNLLHISSYAFSSSHRGGTSVEETACVSGASGLS